MLSSYPKKENMNPELSWEEIKEPVLGWAGVLIQSSREYNGKGESVSFSSWVKHQHDFMIFFLITIIHKQYIQIVKYVMFVCRGPYFPLDMDNCVDAVIHQKISSFLAAYYDSYSYFMSMETCSLGLWVT